MATRVVEKGSLVIDGVPISVSFPPSPASEQEPTPEPEEPKATVKISGISSQLSEELLRIFYENPKKSGGGDIADVQMCLNQGCAYVTFVNPEGWC